MALFRTLFGKPKKEPSAERSLEEHLRTLDALRKPALALIPVAGPAASHIGGLPLLPAGVPWPAWKGAPLAFLCQVDVSQVPPGFGLPSSGMLYFFYDQQQSTWGFDPKDEGSWRVLYSEAGEGRGIARRAPDGLEPEYVYGERSVALSPIATYPGWQDDRVEALGLTDKQLEEYQDLCASVYQGRPEHQLFGYPDAVQSDTMDLECQLVSSGVYCGTPDGYRSAKAKRLEAGRTEWMLLLQLDTDDDAGMMWGDAGRLYFWIRRGDLAARRFERCWMILQCG